MLPLPICRSPTAATTTHWNRKVCDLGVIICLSECQFIKHNFQEHRMYNSHLSNATETEFRIYGIALPVLSIVSVVCNIFVFAVLLRDFDTN